MCEICHLAVGNSIDLTHDFLYRQIPELTSVDDVPSAIAEKLGELLSAAKLPKPEQLTALYAEASGEPRL